MTENSKGSSVEFFEHLIAVALDVLAGGVFLRILWGFLPTLVPALSGSVGEMPFIAALAAMGLWDVLTRIAKRRRLTP